MKKKEKESLLTQIDSALDTVRPHLAIDGGDVELIDITEDGTVQVKWLGNCENCNMAFMTLKAGIEQAIKDRIPEIKQVVAINGPTS